MTQVMNDLGPLAPKLRWKVETAKHQLRQQGIDAEVYETVRDNPTSWQKYGLGLRISGRGGDFGAWQDSDWATPVLKTLAAQGLVQSGEVGEFHLEGLTTEPDGGILKLYNQGGPHAVWFAYGGAGD